MIVIIIMIIIAIADADLSMKEKTTTTTVRPLHRRTTPNFISTDECGQQKSLRRRRGRHDWAVHRPVEDGTRSNSGEDVLSLSRITVIQNSVVGPTFLSYQWVDQL